MQKYPLSIRQVELSWVTQKDPLLVNPDPSSWFILGSPFPEHLDPSLDQQYNPYSRENAYWVQSNPLKVKQYPAI